MSHFRLLTLGQTTIGNWKRWELHVNGLQQLVRTRGGWDGLERNMLVMAF